MKKPFYGFWYSFYTVEIGLYLTLEQLILHRGNLSSINIQTNFLLKQALLNKYSLHLEDRHWLV